MKRNIRHNLTAVCLSAFVSSAAVAEDQCYDFDISENPVDATLGVIAQLTGTPLLLPYDKVKSINANSVSGCFTLEDALKKALDGTGLEAIINDQGVITVQFIEPNQDKAEGETVNKTKKLARNLLLSSTALMSATIAADAQETEAAAEDQVVDTLVVTARGRVENLQDVPDTVATMTASTIERANIVAARDVTMRIPNVSIVESLSPTSTYLIVRGVATTRNTEPAVAVVVDGVQVGSASELSQAFYDVERIELLKGPQGALYGRNAIGGALIVTSKRPTDEFEGKFSTGLGGNGIWEAGGSVSGPISDNLYFRVAGQHRSFDGTIENEHLSAVYDQAKRANVNAENVPDKSYMDFEYNNDFRAQLLWEAGENTTVDLRYARSGLEAGSMWYRNIYRLESDPEQTYEFPIGSNGNPTAFRTIDSYTMKIDHMFDNGSSFSSITNFTDTSERYGMAGETKGHDRTGNVLFFTEPMVDEFIAGLDNDVDRDFFSAQLGAWADGNFVGSDQFYDIETISQEFRLVSDDASDLRYVVGSYFLKTDRADTIRATWETPDGAPFNCTPSYEGGPSISDTSCNGLLNATQNTQDNFAWAVFGNMDYDISDRLTLTLAGRFDQDKREVTRIDGPTVDTDGRGVGACDSSQPGCAVGGSKLERTFNAFQPKASIAYKPNDDMTLYATYARGFRSGGFNAAGSLLVDSYDKETMDSFEVGSKNTFMDGRLRMNFAGFYEDLKNSQQFEFDGNVFVQSVYNIPKSKIYGVEGSFDYSVTDNLTLSASFGLMDSEISEFDQGIFNKLESELLARTANSVKLPAGTQAAFDKMFKGERLPLFAHKTAAVSLQHQVPVQALNGGYLTTRIDYSFMGDRNWWIDGQDVQENISLVDASIGLEIAENTELLAWCKNCTNKVYDSEYGTGERELFGGAMKDVAYRARLRTWGIKLNHRF